MKEMAMSRRLVLEAGAFTLLAAGAAPLARAAANAGPRSTSEGTVRQYYAAWQTKDWHPLDILLTDDFTFSSPLDDHIKKGDFKTGCWDTQIAYIDRFDVQRVIGTEKEAFVMYVCHTTNGKTFRNVENFQFRDGRVSAIECYFGGKSSFPSAVSNGKQ